MNTILKKVILFPGLLLSGLISENVPAEQYWGIPDTKLAYIAKIRTTPGNRFMVIYNPDFCKEIGTACGFFIEHARAHSNNQNQLRLWGPHFIHESFNITPYYSLKYWCIIHQRVLNIGESMHTKFLFLNYDDFCLNPENGTEQLFKFLGLEADNLIHQLDKLIRPPDSVGRFKQYGTKIFAEKDVAYVKSLGFDVG